MLVLDNEAFSLWAEDDERMRARITLAQEKGFVTITSAATIVETAQGGQAGQRLRFKRSKLSVIDVTSEVADLAARLLVATGLSGHDCAVDAIVVATAASASGAAKVASSDGTHIPKLCSVATELRDGPPVDWLRV
ncbi:hypothetical protein ACQEVF_28860 [Nonomuraea polychroma]|uniref:hypothetical protein n=1 Tax=Nonomuraea polychroma TaxID=46176 RepID=UPI003D9299DE